MWNRKTRHKRRYGLEIGQFPERCSSDAEGRANRSLKIMDLTRRITMQKWANEMKTSRNVMWNGRRTDRKIIVVGRQTKICRNQGIKRNLPSPNDAAISLISSGIFDINLMECSSITEKPLQQRQIQLFEVSSKSGDNHVPHQMSTHTVNVAEPVVIAVSLCSWLKCPNFLVNLTAPTRLVTRIWNVPCDDHIPHNRLNGFSVATKRMRITCCILTLSVQLHTPSCNTNSWVISDGAELPVGKVILQSPVQQKYPIRRPYYEDHHSNDDWRWRSLYKLSRLSETGYQRPFCRIADCGYQHTCRETY